MAGIRRDLGHAVSSDGYTFWLQPCGAYSNGDMYFPDAPALIAGCDHYVRFLPAPA